MIITILSTTGILQGHINLLHLLFYIASNINHIILFGVIIFSTFYICLLVILFYKLLKIMFVWVKKINSYSPLIDLTKILLILVINLYFIYYKVSDGCLFFDIHFIYHSFTLGSVSCFIYTIFEKCRNKKLNIFKLVTIFVSIVIIQCALGYFDFIYCLVYVVEKLGYLFHILSYPCETLIYMSVNHEVTHNILTSIINHYPAYCPVDNMQGVIFSPIFNVDGTVLANFCQPILPMEHRFALLFHPYNGFLHVKPSDMSIHMISDAFWNYTNGPIGHFCYTIRPFFIGQFGVQVDVIQYLLNESGFANFIHERGQGIIYSGQFNLAMFDPNHALTFGEARRALNVSTTFMNFTTNQLIPLTAHSSLFDNGWYPARPPTILEYIALKQKVKHITIACVEILRTYNHCWSLTLRNPPYALQTTLIPDTVLFNLAKGISVLQHC